MAGFTRPTGKLRADAEVRWLHGAAQVLFEQRDDAVPAEVAGMSAGIEADAPQHLCIFQQLAGGFAETGFVARASEHAIVAVINMLAAAAWSNATTPRLDARASSTTLPKVSERLGNRNRSPEA